MRRGVRFNPREWLTAGEWITLSGMIACVIGASLTWQRQALQTAVTVPALYVSRVPRPVSGFEVTVGRASVGWAVVAAAVACGAMLLFMPTEREKRLCLVVQTALSAIILGLACLHLGAHAGVMLALVGSALLMAGGALRYR